MIYLVEDDDSIRELVIYTLHSTGMEAQGFAVPSAFWTAVAEQEPDLVLLDIMLPEEDGLEVLKKIRSNTATKHLPVIMLTAKGTEYDQVIGLDCGADDYVTKPFGMMALMARIKAVLREDSPVRRPSGQPEAASHLRRRNTDQPDTQGVRTALSAAGKSGRRLYP